MERESKNVVKVVSEGEEGRMSAKESDRYPRFGTTNI